MKGRIGAIAYLIMGICLLIQLGCVYYVDAQNGDDRNPGTSQRPFKTIHRALQVMSGSDTCYVRDGIYVGDLTIRENLKGSPSHLTTITAQPGHHPAIHSERMMNGFYNKSTPNVHISGFTIHSAEEVGIYLHQAPGCQIVDNVISGSSYGIVVESSNAVTVRGNIVEDNLLWGIWFVESDDAVIVDNIAKGHSDCGIFADNSDGYFIAGNLSHENIEGIGLYAVGDGEIYNNTLDNNQEAGIHCSYAVGNIKTLNNSLTNNRYGFGWYDGMGHLFSDHNNLWNNSYSDYVYATQETVQAGSHDISVDPMYTPEYQLRLESPCIDRGIDVGRPYYGMAPDLGAFECWPRKMLAEGRDKSSAKYQSLYETEHLGRNAPNPFNAITVIPYHISDAKYNGGKAIYTSLKVYNLLGQKVRTLVDEPQKPGHYRVVWDGKDDRGQMVASGVYLYRLNDGENQVSKNAILLK